MIQAILLVVLCAGLLVLVVGGCMHSMDRDHARRLGEHRRMLVRCRACQIAMHPDWIVAPTGLCRDCDAEANGMAHCLRVGQEEAGCSRGIDDSLQDLQTLLRLERTNTGSDHETDAAACAGRRPAPAYSDI